jgi:hypothetical protein
MSRPPQYEPNAQPLAARKSVIDFVGVPQYYQQDDALQSPYTPQYSPYSQQPYMAQTYTPNPYTPNPYNPQPYAPQPYMAQSYSTYPYMQSPYSTPYMSAPEPVAAQPAITEEALREKINSKIESIMDSHRSEVLSSQIERLTDKVGKLSRDLQTRPCAAPATLASHSTHDPITSPNPSSAYYTSSSISSPEHDEELTRRLKRLAADSNRQLRKRF